MKSRITIEVDFENSNLPIIQILQRKSDDVRDSLIQSFLQSLQHTSRWCRIEYIGNFGTFVEENRTFDETHRWKIKPITADELRQEVALMRSTISEKEGK